MNKRFFSLAAAIIALGIASSPALALSSRTFVSGVGSDAGSCPLATPCRTFAYALTQTAPSGEIIVLSSAGYGTLTITQAVSIINVGYFAGVTVASGDGITINAVGNTSVTLRGLTIDGGGTGGNGIVFTSGGSLTIDQCNVLNFVQGTGTGNGGNGIFMVPTSGDHKIFITNTASSNNAGVGVYYVPLSGTASTGFVIDHVTANNNSDGISLRNGSSGAASASIANSTASENVGAGFLFNNITVSLDGSYASGNQGEGIDAGIGTLSIGRTVVANNNIGINITSGTVNSYKDNRIAGNGTPVSGTLTPVNPQ